MKKIEELHFAIRGNGDLNDGEKEILLEAYRELFTQMYGTDIIEAVIKKLEGKNKKNKKLAAITENYMRSIKALDIVSMSDNLSLLLIYNGENNLIGGGRLKVLSEGVGSVPDIAINVSSVEEEREIWKRAISYIEDYFRSLGFNKMYVEIPLSHPNLLFRAQDLGFCEDPEDIVVSSSTRTYLYNKNLERKLDDEFNTSRQ